MMEIPAGYHVKSETQDITVTEDTVITHTLTHFERESHGPSAKVMFFLGVVFLSGVILGVLALKLLQRYYPPAG